MFLKRNYKILLIPAIIVLVVLFFICDEFYDRRKTQITTIQNGIKVITYRMPEKHTAGIALFVAAGSKYDPVGKDGISHFMEHLAFSGTLHRGKDELWKEVKKKGIYLNAETNYNDVIYQMRLLKADLEFGFDLISDIIKNPLFEPREIERERSVIMQEMSTLDNNHDYILSRLSIEKAYKYTPAERSNIGTSQTLSNITREDLINFINTNYYGENIMLCIAGDVKHRDIVKLAKKYLGDIKLKEKIERIEPQSPKYSPENKINIVKKDINGAYLSLLFKGITPTVYKSDNIKANLVVIFDILCNGFSARIPKELRQKRGLIYGGGCNMSLYREPDSDGYFSFSFHVHQDKIQEAYDALIDQIAGFSGTVSDEEVAESIEQIRIGAYMSEENSFSLDTAILIGKNINFYGRYIEQKEILKNLQKVTKETIINTWHDNFITMLKTNKPILTLYGNVNSKKLQNYDNIQAIIN